MKKITLILFTMLLFISSFSNIHAQEDETNANEKTYHIVQIKDDGSSEVLSEWKTYDEAILSQTILQLRYDNLGITKNDTLVYVKNGIVGFHKENDCSVNINYTIDNSNESGYTNGCYGADAAFIDYNDEDNKVKFQIGGVVAWASMDDVDVYPYEAVPNVSSFIVKDGQLYHNIKSGVLDSVYANQLSLGTSITELTDGVTYYSYDTHYFYQNFEDMILDYRENKTTRSANANNPYYNYYQYMNHRTTSSYSTDDIYTYLQESKMLNTNMSEFINNGTSVSAILTQSMLLQGVDAFLQYQNQFGANSLMMLSLAMNESASGKSYLSFTRNNLFGHAAYDSSVDESASRYSSIAASIYSHAKNYISNSYLNASNFTYHGGHFGNKAGGMNVSYASDPYWGEKAAQYYYTVDHALGDKDNGQYAIGISKLDAIDIKDSASSKATTIYTTPKGYEISFIILEQVKNSEGTWYRIQSDMALDNNHTQQSDGMYNFTNSVGYIPADSLKQVINTNQIKGKSYVDITFDAEDGTFYPDSKSITLQVETGTTPVILDPVKENALFDGWDITLGKATTKLTYNATYKNVREINLIEKPKSDYNVGDSLDISNGKLQVKFEDGTNKEVALTTDMITNFNSDEEGIQQVSITYAGKTISYEITISDQKTASVENIQSTADYLVRTYYGMNNLKEEAIHEINSFMESLNDYGTTAVGASQMRALETILQDNIKPRYSVIIKDDVYNLQVSALHGAIKERDSLLYNFMPRTISISLKHNVSSDDQEIFTNVATANEMNFEDAFTIRGKDNFSGYELKDHVIYSIEKPANSENRIYRIYQMQGEDVVALTTNQSENRITFYSNSTEPFALVSYQTTSLENSGDVNENYTIATNGINYINRYILLPIAIVILIVLLFVAFFWYRKVKHYNKHAKKI